MNTPSSASTTPQSEMAPAGDTPPSTAASAGDSSSSSRAPTIEARLATLETDLRSTQKLLQDSELRLKIQRALALVQAVDLEAVTLVAESMLKETSQAVRTIDDKVISKVIDELRRRRPALFRSGPAPRTTIMGGRIDRPNDALGAAAHEAARTGDRNSLLRYLRIRRNA